MSRYATSTLPELVTMLEEVSTLGEFELEDELHMERMLEERQEILDAIQKADAKQLCAEVRQNLATRLQAVLVKNAEHADYLSRIREQIREDLNGLVHSRAAVRGYRPAHAEVPTKHFQDG